MQTYIKPTIYQGQDCVLGAITNILNYKKYPETETIWKTCKIIYKKNSNGIGSLIGTEYSLEEELDWIHNVKLEKIRSENRETYIKNLRGFLEAKEPVLLILDTYYLEHHFDYLTIHSPHIIIATEIIEESIVCVDDYLKFTERIPFEKVFEASTIKGDELAFVHINIEEATVKLTEKNYIDVINENIMYLVGEGYQTINNEENTENIIYGMKGIKEFIQDCNIYFTNIETTELLDKMYNEIINVSNRHLLLAIFIRNSGELYMELEDLFKLFNSYSQEWKIISNMCLKGQYTKDKNMYERVIRKLNETYEQELDCLFKLREELEMFIAK